LHVKVARRPTSNLRESRLIQSERRAIICNTSREDLRPPRLGRAVLHRRWVRGPWWRLNANGSYVFFIRSGSKPIEIEKGKNAIAVPSLDKVPLIIDILITAVRNGELDEQLAQTKKPAALLKYLKTA
jgi:hypothetical protein